jgi:hypothetical protein
MQRHRVARVIGGLLAAHVLPARREKDADVFLIFDVKEPKATSGRILAAPLAPELCLDRPSCPSPALTARSPPPLQAGLPALI